MTMGPEPTMRMRFRSVRFGIPYSIARRDAGWRRGRWRVPCRPVLASAVCSRRAGMGYATVLDATRQIQTTRTKKGSLDGAPLLPELPRGERSGNRRAPRSALDLAGSHAAGADLHAGRLALDQDACDLEVRLPGP